MTKSAETITLDKKSKELSKVHKHKKHGHRHKETCSKLAKAKNIEKAPPIVKTEPEESAPVKPVAFSETSKKALRKLLDHMLHQLEKRDILNTFAQPVNSVNSPGYYQMIKEPMDFSTMHIKLNAGKYSTLKLFKADFDQICYNACTYNTLESDQYKYAEKLQTEGREILSQDKILSLAPTLQYIKEISEEELGFDILKAEEVSRAANVPEAEILEEAKAAAAGAADRLRLYKPKSKMGFVRQREDGSTSLNFLIGGSGFIPGTDQKPVSLGSLIGRVKQGTGALQGYREDRRNLCKAVYPLYYGAYSSHGPCYDSTFANITKDETNLIISSYGEEANTQNFDSVLIPKARNYDYSLFMGDHIIDILTSTDPTSNTKCSEDEQRLIEEDSKLYSDSKPGEADDLAQNDDSKVNFESLKSLADDGIDVSFMDDLQKKYESLSSLEATASLIEDLAKAQVERLSANPPSHFSQIPLPSDQEMELASQVQAKLADMAGQVKPGDVISQKSIRKALGMIL